MEGLHGGFSIAVGLDRIAVARKRRGVILAQSRLVLDDGDLFFHASIIAECMQAIDG